MKFGDMRLRSTCACLALLACGEDAGSASADTHVELAPPADVEVADLIAPDTSAADSTPTEAAVAEPSVSFQFVQAFDGPAVPDVSLAWTPPGGARVQTASDGEGRVAFYDVDWSKGRALLVGFKEHFVVRGMLGGEAEITDPEVIRNARGDILVVMEPLAQPTRIEVSGTAAGVSPSQRLYVAADLPVATQSDGVGSKFRLEVPPETPFHWTAFTWRANPWDGRNIDNVIDGWSAGASAGGSADYTMDIDLVAHSMPKKTVSGTFPLFASDETTLDETGTARVAVLANDGVGLVGAVAKSTVASDNTSVSYDLEWIEPEWATLPTVLFVIGTASETSQQLLKGWPSEGQQAVSLPAPPVWPAATGARVIDEPLVWKVADPSGLVTLVLLRGTGSTARIVAAFNLPANTTEFTIPELPGGHDLFDDGPGLLGAMITICTLDREVVSRLCARYANSKIATVGPAAP